MVVLAPIQKNINSCSKGSIMTIFRGRMDRHLRGILTISQDKKGATNTFAQRNNFPRVCHKTPRMIFLAKI